MSKGFQDFVQSICRAVRAGDANTVINALPYYQYNNGLRYGVLGDGEGQTGDPSLMRTWLAKSRARCRYVSPDTSGHGTLLTSGWPVRGGWSLLEADTFNGRWKINDFTFGDKPSLFRAMHTGSAVLPYGG